MILGIAFLVGGMAVSIGAPADAREARLLAERGVETTATVTDVTIRRGPSGKEYAVADLEFRDESGSSRQSSDVVYCEEPEAISVGDGVEITYDPEEVAATQFADCEQSQEITIPLLIGIAALAAGTVCVLWAWRASHWRRRWWGIAILTVGAVLAGASFDDDCECSEFVYTGAALVVIGTAPLVAPRRSVDGSIGRP
ncbi:MAG: DUF3592 domain-containing protein [Actinomycetota bacterium]|nr:DUF3592 domain-containing protein [Actinomycetota bacterium]